MPAPVYRQIADDLRSRIESGELPRGAQLPAEPELRDRYRVSRNTVRYAFRWLINRGLVETRPGQGTFVTEKVTPFITPLTGDPTTGRGDDGPVYVAEVRGSLRTPTLTEPRVEVLRATTTIQSELGLPAGSQVVSRYRQRYIDGTPWSLQTSFYPMSLIEQGAIRLIQAINIEEGSVEYLRAELGRSQAGYRDKIRVRAPGAAEATFLKLPDDGRICVFEVLRTAYDDAGKPFRLTTSVYPADRNQFEVSVGMPPPAC
jgi:GntR family transcriptional regulator